MLGGPTGSDGWRERESVISVLSLQFDDNDNDDDDINIDPTKIKYVNSFFDISFKAHIWVSFLSELFVITSPPTTKKKKRKKK